MVAILFAAFGGLSALASPTVEELLLSQAKFESLLLEQGKLIAAQAKRLEELESLVQEISITDCDSVHGCVDSRAGMDGCRVNVDVTGPYAGEGNVTCGTRR
tara:strand:- start:328 stop:633 length:306 start_codon:yes stop_codon:yes gene_type:complete